MALAVTAPGFSTACGFFLGKTSDHVLLHGWWAAYGHAHAPAKDF